MARAVARLLLAQTVLLAALLGVAGAAALRPLRRLTQAAHDNDALHPLQLHRPRCSWDGHAVGRPQHDTHDSFEVYPEDCPMGHACVPWGWVTRLDSHDFPVTHTFTLAVRQPSSSSSSSSSAAAAGSDGGAPEAAGSFTLSVGRDGKVKAAVFNDLGAPSGPATATGRGWYEVDSVQLFLSNRRPQLPFLEEEIFMYSAAAPPGAMQVDLLAASEPLAQLTLDPLKMWVIPHVTLRRCDSSGGRGSGSDAE